MQFADYLHGIQDSELHKLDKVRQFRLNTSLLLLFGGHLD